MKKKKMKMMNNLPVLHPMNQMMMGGLPGFPDIFRDVFPQNMPSLPFETGFFGRKFHKWKVMDLVEIKKMEAEGAAADAAKFTANMSKITEAVLFGPRIMNMHSQIKHEQTMREMLERKAEAEVTKIQYETAILANEAKLGDLEVKAKEKQYSHILNDKDDVSEEN